MNSNINKDSDMILLENIVEDYAWVDRLLEEKFNLYALTEENIDDFINADLLVESYSNIDKILASDSSVSTSSSCQFVSNPFCSIEVEQTFNSLVHLNANNDSINDSINDSDSESSIYNISELSKPTMQDIESDEDSLFLEFIDGYDSDDYYQRFGFTPEEKIFSFYC